MGQDSSPLHGQILLHICQPADQLGNTWAAAIFWRLCCCERPWSGLPVAPCLQLPGIHTPERGYTTGFPRHRHLHSDPRCMSACLIHFLHSLANTCYFLFLFLFLFFLEITAILASVKWFPAVVLRTIFQGNRLLQNTRPEEHGPEGNPGYSLRRWC